ncbi:TonB-dependent siderophore receptor [Pseudoroseomonas rhizosphaerae]|uniref:TonB-dependent siderophore receptor n=1 Tax=Teichococcus rhizosphaerae TaxID=1335062 RepID=A0A2C7A5A9_9PROT|nr:FepA family TonB-dependent siderophore receptor [Pseudoroseomonas rhizosphaerae]PHK95268.1 TonB-dependent siderophore receptor [Pseudoroseomonas rhizosphaerae]
MHQIGHRFTRFRGTLRAALLGSVTLLAIPAGPAWSQGGASAQAISYEVPAGPLGSALNSFAQQAGITLSFAPEQVQGRSSPGLRGQSTVDRAFERLLAGSGLEATSRDGTVYTLRATPSPTAGLATSPDAVALPEISVVATAEQALKQAPGVSLITSEDIRRMPPVNDISELVRTMPGVNLTGNSSSGQYGNNRQIDLRGMGPENTLILIDGKPVRSRNSVRMGRSGERNTRGDSNWVPVDAIERIEVIRGPAAARYGSGAAGGVVNIITKPPTDEYHGSVTLYALQPEDRNEGDGRRATVNLSGPTTLPGLSFRAYGNFNRTDADSLELNRAASGTAAGDTPPAGREGVENRDVNGLLRWDITAGQSLELELGYSRQGNIYAGDRAVSTAGTALLSQLANEGAETNIMTRTTASVQHRGDWGWADSRVLFLYEGTNNKRLNEGLAGSTEGSINTANGYSTATLNNYTLNGELNIPLEILAPQRLTIGAEFFRENLDDPQSVTQSLATGGVIPGISSGLRPGSASAETYSMFVEDNIYATSRLVLTPGVRFDHHSEFGSNWSPSLNASYELFDGFSVKGGIARAFKAPNLYQSNPNYIYFTMGNGCPAGFPSLGAGCYVQGNADLEPETSLNKEIGVSYNSGGFSSSLTYFHNDYRDKIVAGVVPVGQTGARGRIFRWENTPEAVIQGIEGNILIPVLDTLSWSTNVTYMIESKDKSTGQPLSLVPEYTVNSTVDWQARDDLSFRAGVTFYGRQEARTIDLLGNANTGSELWERKPYSVVDISGTYHINDNTRLTLGVLNLFDKQLFREANSSAAGANTYNEPGRAYFASLTASF